ncbi:unnamed protein product [Strongylus vulgaris]|uniref:GMEB1/2/Spe-44-like domain-containing protein n=1 Tax=Strongylus vulgaris TaxID=40348 RepID=A0A3P7KWK8_STRVU|nr:unnamed protein product [Strongylus vulgaris]
MSSNNENSSNNNYIQLNSDDNVQPTTVTVTTFNANRQECAEEIVDVDDSLVTTQTPNVPTTEQILLLMLTEPVSFWNEMHKFGLLDELVEQLTQCLLDIKKAAKNGGLAWAAPVLTRVVSVLDMSDRIANCIHAKPCERLPNRMLSMPRIIADGSSAGENTQKRVMDETLQLFLPHCFPVVKKPRFQNTSNTVSYPESMDPQVVRAVVSGESRMTQDQGIFVPTDISCMSGPLLSSKFA